MNLANSIKAAFAVAALVGLCAPPAPAQVCVGDCDGDERVSIAELVRSVGIAVGRPIPFSCLAVDRNVNDAVSIDELMVAVNNSLFGCRGHATVFATAIASDFSSGGYAAVDLDSRSPLFVADASHTASTDPVPRIAAGLGLVIDRFFGDSITARDPMNDFAPVWQCSTGLGPQGETLNPQDVVIVDANKGYVSRLGSPDLLIFDPSPANDCSDFEIGTISLADLADEDGIPEMSQMVLRDGQLYVALQLLTNFAPSGPSAIAVIDTETDAVVDTITLAGSNPFGATKGLTIRGGDLYVPQIGTFGAADGGLERIALDSGASAGFIVSEEALGGDLNDFVLVSDTLAYAIVGFSDFTNALIAFDPSDGTIGPEIIARGASLSDVELNDRAELYVADRGASPGLRVFDAASGSELTTTPIDTGLPPFELIFLR